MATEANTLTDSRWQGPDTSLSGRLAAAQAEVTRRNRERQCGVIETAVAPAPENGMLSRGTDSVPARLNAYGHLIEQLRKDVENLSLQIGQLQDAVASLKQRSTKR
jgi:hypothetical protein